MANSAKDLDMLATKANEAYARAQTHFRTGMEHALAAGKALVKAKRLVDHGGWSTWLHKNFAGSERTAELYMRLVRRLELLDDETRNAVAEMSLRDADRYFATPRTITVREQKWPIPVPSGQVIVSEREPVGTTSRLAGLSSSGRPDLKVVASTTAKERKAAERTSGLSRPAGKPALRPVSGTWTVPQLIEFTRSRTPGEAVQELAENPSLTGRDLNSLQRWLRKAADDLASFVHVSGSRL